MNHQHAPSPDYSIGGPTYHTDDLTVLTCCDCGDLCMVFTGAKRCDPCLQQHLDELATAKRLLAENRSTVLVSAFQPSGGMNDPREILCDSCGEVAVTYTGCADSLDRNYLRGDCGCTGSIDVDQDDEGVVRVRFLAMGDGRK